MVCEHFSVRRTRAKFTNQNDFTKKGLLLKQQPSHKLTLFMPPNEEQTARTNLNREVLHLRK